MSKYWQERIAKSQAKLTEKNIKQTEKQLAKYYERTMRGVIADFVDVYDKLLLTVAAGKQPVPADLYKLDKYWKLQGQLQVELEKLGNYSTKILSKNFVSEYQQIYEVLALKDDLYFGTMSKENALQMINQIWCADGKSWSSRIWTNTTKLREALNDNLIHCVVSGKKTSDLKKLLQNDFGVSFNNADMIVRTEMAHIQTQAAIKRYEDMGITEVEILADEDERRCDVCGELHQKRYNIHAAVPLPAHPRCRCCIVPVVEI